MKPTLVSELAPTQVMDHVRDIHKDVLVGLISHPGLRIRKDLARYALAEHILKLGLNVGWRFENALDDQNQQFNLTQTS